MERETAFRGLCEIIERLRGEGGCPWDREQTPQSLREDLLEECYECIEAIDGHDSGHIKEELGDLYLLVTMLSYMHEQEGLFSIASVLDVVSEKLVRRHPHVFGELRVRNEAGKLSSDQVLDNWARIKVEQEGRSPKDSILDEVSRSLPPLDRAFKLQKKAAKAGFDWPSLDGVMAKVEEELKELKAALAEAGENGAAPSKTVSAHIEEELGDLLFSVANLSRALKVEPSVALQGTNSKFTRRFKHVERRMKETGRAMTAENLAAMDAYWEEAKAASVPIQNA